MLEPIRDRVAVKLLDDETLKSASLVIPDAIDQEPTKGKVVAVGPGKLLDNGETVGLQIKLDDIVIFGKYQGQTIRVNGEEFHVLKEDDVYAIVREEGGE
jgi:chaperonin GroES